MFFLSIYTGKAWSAVTTEGLLVFMIDVGIVFDPFDLTADVTPDVIRQSLRNREHAHALMMSIHLNEPDLIVESIEQIPVTDGKTILNSCHM